MNTSPAIHPRIRPEGAPYALCREADTWRVSFEGRQSSFRHELGALYVACLLSEPPGKPIHGVALALKAREKFRRVDSAGFQPMNSLPVDFGATEGRVRACSVEADEAFEERAMGIEDADSVRALWRRQRELERVLADRLEIEPVKAEALSELEEITERLRQSPWMSHQGAERCARAVAVAIKRLHARLAGAVDPAGKPDEVLRAFALHLHAHLLAPSGRGGGHDRGQAWAEPGWFIYVPLANVVWVVQRPESKAQCPESKVQSPESKVLSLESGVLSLRSSGRGAAAVDYLARFLCAGFALALLASGCAGPRPLKGGKAVTTRKPAGVIEQTLLQGENPSQATKQDQETVKVRTYTVPAGSRVEQLNAECGVRSAEWQRAEAVNAHARPSTSFAASRQPHSTLNPQPSTAFLISAPMPVFEREETRARTELGAAQKDTARELGAKLASLKGIVWVGAGLFVFGLASLVWPPLKAVIGSVTTSAAMMLGGVALMVLPSLVVGNELLILGIVAVAVGGWFLAHRHGQLRGEVSSLKSQV
jgi:hypothetical protein